MFCLYFLGDVMKKLFLVLFVGSFAAAGFGFDVSLEKVHKVFEKPAAEHPRLFLNDEQLKEVLKDIKNSNQKTIKFHLI